MRPTQDPADNPAPAPEYGVAWVCWNCGLESTVEPLVCPRCGVKQNCTSCR